MTKTLILVAVFLAGGLAPRAAWPQSLPAQVPAPGLPAPAPAIPATPPTPIAPIVPAMPAGPVAPLPPWPFTATPFHFSGDVHAFAFDMQDLHRDLALYAPFAQAPAVGIPGLYASADGGQYEQARTYIESSQFERAVALLDRVIGAGGPRADAAMYWKAYSQSKLARPADALTTLAELQTRFGSSAWLRDARALEAEIRQASGQPLAADAQDDELKLLALRGLMQSDTEAALPVLEQMLAGGANVRVKDRALFVLGQSRAARAREILVGVARSSTNPDLRLQAIRYLGMRSDTESRQVLDAIYRDTTDIDVKRSILHSMTTTGARDRLLAVARSEGVPELRSEAVRQLGTMRAGGEIEELYRKETNRDVKQRMLEALFIAGAADRLGALARAEKDPDLRRVAIRQLGLVNRPEATEALSAIYAADTSTDTRRAIVDALALQRSAAPLVALARAERNPELKREMVQRLSTHRSPEARAYLLELLK